MDYHAHVYFNDDEQTHALALKAAIALAFPQMQVGRFHLRIGPHTKALFQIAYAKEDSAALMAYFDQYLPARSVLIHPLIDDMLAAHTTAAAWRGEVLPLNISVFSA